MAGNRPNQIRQFLLEQIPDHPQDIVVTAMQAFGVSRPTVHRHLNKLLKEGHVLKTGRTSGVSYYLSSAFDKKLKFKIESGLSEHDVWMQYLRSHFQNFPENVQEICEYGFGEMFNNAIDHSEGTEIQVTTTLDIDERSIDIIIQDDGVGIFKKIKGVFSLASEREALFQLSKGKLTTDKENHSGEGIFFTSKAMDEFTIMSYGITYRRENLEKDWFLESELIPFPGTGIIMSIHFESQTILADIFKQFTSVDSENIPQFDKTHFLVELGKLGDERYISRSQAKRILLGLEKFNEVVLDFEQVKTVGQGFVDEVFRIFKNKHPHIKITYTNANEDVEFMIERGIPRENPK